MIFFVVIDHLKKVFNANALWRRSFPFLYIKITGCPVWYGCAIDLAISLVSSTSFSIAKKNKQMKQIKHKRNEQSTNCVCSHFAFKVINHACTIFLLPSHRMRHQWLSFFSFNAIFQQSFTKRIFLHSQHLPFFSIQNGIEMDPARYLFIPLSSDLTPFPYAPP